MAGIYIHIPFCKQACNYCDFHFSTSMQQSVPLINALIQEIALRKDYVTEPIETIYFGGGTPSLLETRWISQIINSLQKHFIITKDAEITLEANPDDIEPNNISEWKAAGINRMSVGIQSFHPHLLSWMNRAHLATQSISAIRLLQEGGFENISIDLIYGCPNQSDVEWKQDMDTAISLGVQHLSCYALTSEPKTALWNHIQKGISPELNTDQQANQFLQLMYYMEAAGYEQYEISNFSLPNFRSRHNSAYWKGIPYLGIGPSAHSFNGITREWNINNNSRYIESITAGIIPATKEELSETQRFNEYIMTTLRTREGISKKKVEAHWGAGVLQKLTHDAHKWTMQSLLTEKEEFFQLTTQGKLMADGIAADLFQ